MHQSGCFGACAVGSAAAEPRTATLQGYSVKQIAEYASNRGFTNLIVLNENRKEVNGLLLVHLPHGPTARFRLSNLKLSREIKARSSTLCSLSRPTWALEVPLKAISVHSCGGADVW